MSITSRLAKLIKEQLDTDFVSIDTNNCTLNTLINKVVAGDIVIDDAVEYVTDETKAAEFITRIVRCGSSVEYVFRGYKDQLGNTHLTDASELRLLIDALTSPEIDASRIALRRILSYTIRIETVSNWQRNDEQIATAVKELGFGPNK